MEDMPRRRTEITADSGRWDSIWRNPEKSNNEWDYLSEVVFQVLKNEVGSFKDKSIMEAGSGSGRISLRLANLRAQVALMDYSLSAISISKKMFKDSGTNATFIQADIRNMPIRNFSEDIVWNAGVLEHFSHKVQSEILSNLIRATKKKGLVITLNPYARSLLYNVGKKFLIKANRWVFGKEYPIRSICDIYKSIDEDFIVKEYSIGFIVFFVDAYKFMPKKIQGLKIISGMFIKLAPYLFFLDRVLSTLFGGYLIVSVIKRKET